MIPRAVMGMLVICFALTAASGVARAEEPSVLSTKELWADQCVRCHGKDGKGQTKMGKRFGAKDLTDETVRADFDRERMLAAIRGGVTRDGGEEVMKGYADDLSEADILQLLDFVLNNEFGE